MTLMAANWATGITRRVRCRARFANATERPGWLRVRGEESLASLNRTSLLTRKLTSVYATVTTKMEFEPEVYQHSAGLTIYYDNMNNIFPAQVLFADAWWQCDFDRASRKRRKRRKCLTLVLPWKISDLLPFEH